MSPDGELGCLCGKAGTSHLCDGSAHSSGCVVNGCNAMAAVLLLFLCSTMHTFGHAEIHQARQGILKQGSNKHRHTQRQCYDHRETNSSSYMSIILLTALGSLQLPEIGVHRHVC